MQKLWSFRAPLIFLFLGLIFLLAASLSFYQEKTSGQSVVISNPSLNSPKALTPQTFKVDISGAVEKPGVYGLKSDSRIQDALISAGGLSADADRDFVSKNLNLAQKLSDGAKIYIPKIGESASWRTSSPNSPTAPNSLINLNSSSQQDLESLPGIGPASSQKIISNRPYQSIDDLLSKKIVGKSVFEKIKDKITVY